MKNPFGHPTNLAQDAIFIDIKIITVRPPVRIRINTYY